MKNAFLLIFLAALLITPIAVQGQVEDWQQSGGLLYDFESNFSDWWSFSCSTDDGQAFYFDANPDNSGINTSDSVGVFETTAACTWEGFGCMFEFLPFDFATYPIVTIKVWAPDAGLSLMLKAENYADNQASPVEVYGTTALGGEWEEMVYDFSACATTGVDYERLIFFPDFGSNADSDVWLFDNVIIEGVESSKVENRVQQPTNLLLASNYPNPFNPQTTIAYELPITSEVNLTVYDALGRNVQTLVNELQNSGAYEIIFDGSRLASGIYYYKLRAGHQVITRKMILMK